MFATEHNYQTIVHRALDFRVVTPSYIFTGVQIALLQNSPRGLGAPFYKKAQELRGVTL